MSSEASKRHVLDFAKYYQKLLFPFLAQIQEWDAIIFTRILVDAFQYIF